MVEDTYPLSMAQGEEILVQGRERRGPGDCGGRGGGMEKELLLTMVLRNLRRREG